MQGETLDDKLDIIEDAITSRLGESALSDTSYRSFLKRHLRSQGLLGPRYDLFGNAGIAGQYSAMFRQRIPTTPLKGLKRDYETLESTILSPRVQDDVDHFQRLQDELGEYLREVIGEQPVSERDYKRQINLFTLKYLRNNRKIIGIFQFAGLKGWLGAHYKKDFNITPKQEYIGPVPSEQFYEAMQKKQ